MMTACVIRKRADELAKAVLCIVTEFNTMIQVTFQNIEKVMS